MPQSMLLMTWQEVSSDLIHLGLAYLLALPIGWDREQEVHTAGIRTFPLVAVANCGIILMVTSVPGHSFDNLSQVLQGILTGIGFIGGGAILRDQASVKGTATAASVFNIAIVGCAVGFRLYHIAVVLAALNLFTLRALRGLKKATVSKPETPAPLP